MSRPGVAGAAGRAAAVSAVVVLLAAVSAGCGTRVVEHGAAAAIKTVTTTEPVTLSQPVTPAPPASSAIPDSVSGASVGSSGCGVPAADRVAAGSIVIDSASGRRRSLVSLPAGAGSVPPVPAPFVVDLHGYTQSAEGHSALDALAARGASAGMVVATPQALGELTLWNATEVAGLPDDVAFISSLIDRLLATACIDTTRIAVVGGSNGAFMASTVGCRLADRVTTIAAVAGLLFPAGCNPADTVSVLAVHGLEDDLVPLSGGLGPKRSTLVLNTASRAVFDRLPVVPVPTAAAGWAWLAGCGGRPGRSTPARWIERSTWNSCREGAEVRLDVVEGGGHGWFGSEAFRSWGAREGDPVLAEDTSGEIIAFVEAHPRGEAQARGAAGSGR